MGPRRVVDAVSSLKPSPTDIQSIILPAIRDALEQTSNRDITSSCLMALAKIGRDHSNFEILPILQKHLVTLDQEVRETAALAMGLTRMAAAFAPLREVALDSAAGRKLVDRTRVNYRTRAFAIYGLGLIGYGTEDLDLKSEVFEVARSILTGDKSQSGNVFVAAIHVAGLLNISGQSDKAEKLRARAVSVLRNYFAQPLGAREEFMQSHVPNALAKLLGRGDSAVHTALKADYVAILMGRKPRGAAERTFGNNVVRSAALALGQLALPTAKDADVHKALIRFASGGRDAQARYFAMISLGQIGGTATRGALLRILTKGSKSTERPWAALALGMAEFRAAREPGWSPDATIGEAIRSQFQSVRNPAARGAFALALGLSRYQAAGGDLLDALKRYRHQDDFAGHLCVALALMDYRSALPVIEGIVDTSVRRPELLQRAAIGLGKMGDKRVARSLMAKLSDREPNLAKLGAVASALGYIGDRRTIKPLEKMLDDDSLTKLTRAFAAVALGMVADKDRLPWNSKIGENLNYRATVETLTNFGTGILDIL